jgi:hypothetical protein
MRRSALQLWLQGASENPVCLQCGREMDGYTRQIYRRAPAYWSEYAKSSRLTISTLEPVLGD